MLHVNSYDNIDIEALDKSPIQTWAEHESIGKLHGDDILVKQAMIDMELKCK